MASPDDHFFIIDPNCKTEGYCDKVTANICEQSLCAVPLTPEVAQIWLGSPFLEANLRETNIAVLSLISESCIRGTPS